jgi:hypothetical protein
MSMLLSLDVKRRDWDSIKSTSIEYIYLCVLINFTSEFYALISHILYLQIRASVIGMHIEVSKIHVCIPKIYKVATLKIRKIHILNACLRKDCSVGWPQNVFPRLIIHFCLLEKVRFCEIVAINPCVNILHFWMNFSKSTLWSKIYVVTLLLCIYTRSDKTLESYIIVIGHHNQTLVQINRD